MKKITLLVLLIFTSLVFSACSISSNSKTTSSSNSDLKTSKSDTSSSDQCKKEDVTIEGYGEKGKKLANCFVEYPGEPSREDKSYYVVEDVCGQFTKEFVERTLEKTIVKIKPPDKDTLYNCSYYYNDNDYVMLVFEYLSIANQKTGQESMGRTTVEDITIPMRNMVVYEGEVINTIYLVLGDEKFISIKRNNESNLSSEALLKFATNLAEGIKNYK